MSVSRGSLGSDWRPVGLGFLVALMGVGGMAKAKAGALKVKVGKTRIIMRGANYPGLCKFADGSIILQARAHGGKTPAIRSTDAGNTWKPCKPAAPLHFDGERIQLRDGMVLVLAYHAVPVKDKPGWYEVRRWESDDNWQTARGPLKGQAHIPQGAPGCDDGGKTTGREYVHGNIVELPDGSLLATVYGYFKADVRPGESGGKIGHLRSFLIKSEDRGKTWEYLSTIASVDMITDARLKRHLHEGFDEPTMARLPDGTLICVMRVGTYSASAAASGTYHDLSNTILQKGKYRGPGSRKTSPLYQTLSTDDGKTWSRPAPMKQACGACPRLLLLGNGVLALSYGRIRRPTQDDYIIFSGDGGKTWSGETCIFRGLSSGYTDMVEIGPGKLLCVFDSVTAWGPKYTPDWIGAVDIEVKAK